MERYYSSEVQHALNSTYGNLVSAIEDFQQRGSGWVLNKLLTLDLHLVEFNPLGATSYIPLPQGVHNRKSVIIFKLLRSVIAGIYGVSSVEHHERVSRYTQHEEELNFMVFHSQKFE